MTIQTVIAPAKTKAKVVPTRSSESEQLLIEACKLVAPTNLKKLGHVKVDVLMTFASFWHEAIVAGLDTEALLDFANNWRLLASAKAAPKPTTGNYRLALRALEEIGLLDSPAQRKRK